MKPVGCREAKVGFTMADAVATPNTRIWLFGHADAVDNMIHVIVKTLFEKEAEMLAGQMGTNCLPLEYFKEKGLKIH